MSKDNEDAQLNKQRQQFQAPAFMTADELQQEYEYELPQEELQQWMEANVTLETEQVERVITEERSSAQTLPASTPQVSEPIQQQKMSGKQKKKLRNQHKKDAVIECRQRIKSAIDSVSQEPENSIYRFRIMDYSEQKLYGKMLSNRSFITPQANAYKQRNNEFYDQHEGLARGSVTRELSEFMGTVETTDAQMLTMHRNIITSTTPTLPEEERMKAAQEVLPTYFAAYERIRASVKASGALDEKPFLNNEDIVVRCDKIMDVYRIAQVTRDIGNAMPAGLVPLETLAFVSATCEHAKGMMDAADYCMQTDKASKESLKRSLSMGVCSFSAVYQLNLQQRLARAGRNN